MTKFTKFILLLMLSVTLLALTTQPLNLLGTLSVSGQPPFVYHFPMFNYQSSYLTSNSYYMTTLNPDLLYNLGCQLGTRDQNTPGAQDGVVVLAFGYPRCYDAGEYGANLYGYGPATTENIQAAVKPLALGYYTCTGSDNHSNLVIGVGTSNYQGPQDPCDSQAKAAVHGAAWSAMVHDLNQWAANQGILQQIQFYGANDIEVGWNSPAWTRAWIAGFEQVSGNFLLHFGDAAGCPYEDNPHWACGTAAYPQWSQEDVWFVSYGAPSALPLPLIYLTNGVHAKQWAYLSQYSLANHGYRMDFTGVFTQSAYCQQFGWCEDTDNTPEMASQQLSFELSKNPATAQHLRWLTDIRWIMQDEITRAEFIQAETDEEDQVHPILAQAAEMESELQTATLSPELRASLETKQATYLDLAEMIARSNQNPAAKDGSIAFASSSDVSVDFVSGIIENGEMPGIPYGVTINTVWQSEVPEGYMQVGAGTAPTDPERGALYIVQSLPDQIAFRSTLIPAPEGCGPLFITGQADNLLYVQSSDGCQFSLDVLTWNLDQVP